MARKDSRQAKAQRRAKKGAKDRRKGQRRQPAPSRILLSGLTEAEDLLKRGSLEEAVEVLEELARRYPRRVEVLGMLVDAHLERQDMWSYQSVCRRLVDLAPDEADLWFELAAAALGNSQLATAQRSFSHLLERWPEHPEAETARGLRDDLEEFLRGELAQRGIEQEGGFDLLILHDEINLHLQLGEFDEVIRVAGRLLERCPTFAPALNNRSEAQFRSGHLDRAIADARRVLEFDAANSHALGNVTRFLFLSGEFEESQVVADRLKRAESDSPELFVKQAESLSFLGDWQGVLDALRGAERSGLAEGADLGMLYHLAGVAAAELGQHDVARKHWKRAVKLTPSLEWAQQNLADLKLPPGEQNGPWAFPLDNWIPRPVFDRLVAGLSRAGREVSDAEARRHVGKFLEQHPNVERLAPVLLQRGDPVAKEFIVRVASLGETPGILSALRDFAFGRRGTDKLRHAAAMRLVESEVLEPGPTRMWVEGELSDVNLMSFEITEEPTDPLPDEVQPLGRKILAALQKGDGAAAEPLLDEAIKRYPEGRSLAFNRAVAVQMQGREEEALALVRELHARHPDYVFARMKLAEDAVKRRDYAEAHELLDPLLRRRRFHLSEYTALCHAYILLLDAQEETEGARAWLNMWQDIAPDDERAEYWSDQLNERDWLSRMFRRRRPKSQTRTRR